MVDNFGVKYMGEEPTEHLIQALLRDYKLQVDKGGCGISLDWDYEKQTLDISITK